jgi:hypothetical protein
MEDTSLTCFGDYILGPRGFRLNHFAVDGEEPLRVLSTRSNALKALLSAALLFLSALVPATISQEAEAATPTTSGIELGAASSFVVLAGTGITHLGTFDGLDYRSVARGSNGADFGSSPNAGFTGSETVSTIGTKYVGVNASGAEAQTVMTNAKTSLESAYAEAFGRTSDAVLPTKEIGGQTLTSGVYNRGDMQISGTLTLDAAMEPDAVFVFKSASTLVTMQNSKIILINGAQACNVFWQVGSSATLGGDSDFSGSILAHTSITAENGADIDGQLLAKYGAVTLINNTFVNDSCVVSSVSSSPEDVPVTRGQAKTTVSWSAPSATGGSSITGYTARAYEVETGGTAVASCSTTNLTCEITGLSNGTTYYVGVTAANGMGESVESSPRVSVVPAAAPGAPTISSVTVGNQSLSAAFSAGSADGNSPISGYQYSLDDGSNWLDSPATSSPLLITGLTNGTSYDLKIRAQSDIGVGEPSDTFSKTPIAKPEDVDPSTISYVASGSSAQVRWTAPNTNGAELISTVATAFSSESGGTSIGTCTAITTATTCEISGLNNGTTYYVTLVARNSAGNSDPSDPRVVLQPGSASTTTMTMSTSSAQAGSSVSLSAAVTDGATGTVNFTTDSVSISGCDAVAISSNQAVCTTTALAAKTHAIQANYSGDVNYGSSATISQSLVILSFFTITYNANGGSGGIASATFTTGGTELVLPTLTKTSHSLDGWYSSSSLATKIGNAGDDYTPSSTRTLYAKWVEASAYATGDNTKIGSITTQDDVGNSTYFANAGTQIQVTYPPDALPDETVLDIYLLTDSDRANSLVPGDKSFVLNLAVDWLAADGTVPNTVERMPITVMVTNSAIKKGSRVYSLLGETVKDLGVALEDGSATVLITEVSEIVVVLTNPDAPTGVSATTTTNSATITFTAPAGNGGASVTTYVATASTGESCSSSGTSCTITGLSSSTGYTFTVRAINSIGTSIASLASASVSTAESASSSSSSSSGSGSGGGGGGGGGGAPVSDQEEKELDDLDPDKKLDEAIDREFKPIPPSKPVKETGVIATEDGNGAQLVVARDETDEKMIIKGTGWELNIGAAKKDGTPKPLASDYGISAMDGEKVVLGGSGMAPNTWVDLYVFSDPVFVGTVETDAQGAFDADFDIPSGLSIGAHTLVLGTKNQAGEEVTVTMGLLVLASVVPSEKANAGSFLGYVAVYALGHKGSTISWKIAGEWFKTKVTSRYQVFQRKTLDVGVDIKVDIYITAAGGDPVKKLSKLVRTR